MKRIIAILVCFVLCLCQRPSHAVEAVGPSSWAEPEVTAAIEQGLVPSALQNSYQEPITRAEFVKTIITFLMVQCGYDVGRDDETAMLLDFYYDCRIYRSGRNGETIPYPGDMDATPFEDIQDCPYADEIRLAYHLNLVNGRDQKVFDPTGLVTRQEAAAILGRTYQCYGGALLSQERQVSLADWALVADWAQPHVALFASMDILKGDKESNFAPLGICTREQAYLILHRLYRNAPTSRARGNVAPWVPPEKKISEQLAGSDWQRFELLGRFDNDLCTVLYGNVSGWHIVGDWYTLHVFYQRGGWFDAAKTITEQYAQSRSQPFDSICLDGNRLTVRKAHDDGTFSHYEINLTDGTVAPCD